MISHVLTVFKGRMHFREWAHRSECGYTRENACPVRVRNVQKFESRLVMGEWKDSDVEHSSSKICTLSVATSVNDCSGLEVQSFSESRAKEPVPDDSCGTSHAITKRARGKKTLTLLLWSIPST